jgi:acetyl esterase
MELDPDAARALELIKAAGRPPYETLTAAEARQAYSSARVAVAPEPQEVAAVKGLSAPGPNGPIPLRHYLPLGAAAGQPLPGLVYCHGGGWVLGDLDSHDTVCRHLANAARCAVVAVDYRVAPEHKFPAAVDDAMAATAWVAEHGADLGIDPERLAVGGDSAGATLAAVTCLAARDAGRPKLRYQVLVYPVTDCDMRTPSQEQFADGHLLTRGNQLWFQANYLRGPADKADWRASPLKVASVAGVPPALVLTASHDPLRDEGEAYARRLVEAGIRITSWRVPGQIHGFLPMGKLMRASAPALDEIARHLRTALGW